MTRTAVYIVGMITMLVIGSLTAVTITAIYASAQTAIIVGIVSSMVVTVITALLAILQGMNNNVKLDSSRVQLAAVQQGVNDARTTAAEATAVAATTLNTLNAAHNSLSDQIASIHATVHDTLGKP